MTKKVNPSPTLNTPALLNDLASVRTWAADFTQGTHRELKDHATRLNLAFERDGLDRMEAPLPLQQVATAGLPVAADWAGSVIFVTDDADGAQPFFSDGTTWYRFYDLLSLTATLSAYLLKTQNLADLNNVATARTNLGLGTAAVLDTGTTANKIVQLDGSAKIPALDGSQLTNLPAQSGRLLAGTPLVLNPFSYSSTTTQAHGLGVTPIYIANALECINAAGSQGYSLGEILDVGIGFFYPQIIKDATNIILISPSAGIAIPNKSTHVVGGITAADWKLTLTPYATS